MSPLLLLLIIAAGGAAVYAYSQTEKYALSEDCQTNKLADMGPQEVSDWLAAHVEEPFNRAREGRGVIAMRPVDGQILPPFVAKEIQSSQDALVADGMSLEDAKKLFRIEGTTVYFPAEPGDPFEIALYLYQQIAHPKCAVIQVKNWMADVNGPDNGIKEYVWPSQAAECLFQAFYVSIKMALFAETLDDSYQVTEEELMAAANACPQNRTAWAGTPARGGAMTSYGVSIGNNGMGTDGINYRAMARDANAGHLHPAHVLSGAVFR